MDPTALVASLRAAAKAVSQVSTALGFFSNKSSDVDQTLQSFLRELESLRGSIDATYELVISTFRNPFIQVIGPTQDGTLQGLWQSMKESLTDCRMTFDELHKALLNIQGNTQGRRFSRHAAQTTLDMNAENIAVLRSQILIHTLAVDLALQAMNVYTACKQSNITVEDLQQKIDSLTSMISHLDLTGSKRADFMDAHNAHILRNTMKLRVAAQKVGFATRAMIEPIVEDEGVSGLMLSVHQSHSSQLSRDQRGNPMMNGMPYNASINPRLSRQSMNDIRSLTIPVADPPRSNRAPHSRKRADISTWRHSVSDLEESLVVNSGSHCTRVDLSIDEPKPYDQLSMRPMRPARESKTRRSLGHISSTPDLHEVRQQTRRSSLISTQFPLRRYSTFSHLNLTTQFEDSGLGSQMGVNSKMYGSWGNSQNKNLQNHVAPDRNLLKKSQSSVSLTPGFNAAQNNTSNSRFLRTSAITAIDPMSRKERLSRADKPQTGERVLRRSNTVNHTKFPLSKRAVAIDDLKSDNLFLGLGETRPRTVRFSSQISQDIPDNSRRSWFDLKSLRSTFSKIRVATSSPIFGQST